MCPYHHFTPSAFCRYCAAFAGGFVGGFAKAPYQWYKGNERIRSQQGIILSAPGNEEEEENRLLGREMRAVSRLLTGQNIDHARAAWRRLPDGTRTRLTESGFEALGSFAGGMAASQVFLFGLSYLGGRFVALSPRLRPLMLVRTPMAIAAGAILSTLSLQGSFSLLISRQRQIFNDYPGSEAALREALDRATKDRDKADRG